MKSTTGNTLTLGERSIAQQVSIVRAMRRAPALLSLLVALSGLIGCQEDETRSDQPSDSVLVRIIFDSFSANMRASSIVKAEDLFTADYLHQGFDRNDLGLWLQSFVDREGLVFSFDQFTLDVNGEDATIGYFLEVKSCIQVIPKEDDDEDEESEDPPEEPEAEPTPEEVCEVLLRCRSEAGGRCGQWTHLRKIGNVWRFAGDQSAVGLDLKLRATGDGLFAVGQIRDSKRELKAIRGTWKGTEQPIEFESRSGGTWHPVDGRVPDGFYPSSPLPWTLTLDVDGSSGKTKLEHQFLKFNDQFGSDLQPNGEAAAPFTFRWTNGANALGGSQIEIVKDTMTLWRSPVVYTETLKYSGPSLTPGERVDVRLFNFDIYGNSAVTEGTLVPVDKTVITPAPSDIDPSSGAKSGGAQITIKGTGFLTGVSVLFGSVNAIDVVLVDDSTITCVAPALAPGTYNVIVANPGGQTGVLEQAYTALEISEDGN